MQFELKNTTPFVPFQFESVDTELNHFGVTVLRGTFDIKNKHSMLLSMEQTTMVLEDEYYGDPLSSSLRLDSCMAPYKPKTDVLIEAAAYSPSGRPEESWICEVHVGPISKEFRVTGARKWTKGLLGYSLSQIEPATIVPVRYELAFGGSSLTQPDLRHGMNPVGTGLATKDAAAEVRCPQILPTTVENPIYGMKYQSEGLTPIAPSWQPRLEHSGTYDDRWIQERSPYLPDDFSFEFYNVAPPDLRFPGFAEGNETFRLVNLSDDHELIFALPGIDMMTLIELEDGRIVPGPMNLDTIEIQVEDRRAILHWRAIHPAHFSIRQIELQMSAPDYLVED